MTRNSSNRKRFQPQEPVIRWLLDSDPSIRWQVMRDLTGAPTEEVAAERARISTEGYGARLLGLKGSDGSWGGAAWNRVWNSTMHVLMLLRDLGLDPTSSEARRAAGHVATGLPGRDAAPRKRTKTRSLPAKWRNPGRFRGPGFIGDERGFKPIAAGERDTEVRRPVDRRHQLPEKSEFRGIPATHAAATTPIVTQLTCATQSARVGHFSSNPTLASGRRNNHEKTQKPSIDG